MALSRVYWITSKLWCWTFSISQFKYIWWTELCFGFKCICLWLMEDGKKRTNTNEEIKYICQNERSVLISFIYFLHRNRSNSLSYHREMFALWFYHIYLYGLSLVLIVYVFAQQTYVNVIKFNNVSTVVGKIPYSLIIIIKSNFVFNSALIYHQPSYSKYLH